MKEIAVCTVAFGDHRYLEQQVRLLDTLAQTNPAVHALYWTNKLPPGSQPHEQSLYGFKVHAVQAARDLGYTRVIWLDPACIVRGDLEYYFEGYKPVVAVKDDNKLDDTISDKALRYYDNPETIEWYLVGGSLYTFDFSIQLAVDVFEHWKRAEAKGIFGSQKEAASEQINKHRYDESCMAVSMYLHNIEPVGNSVARYCLDLGSIIEKKHFK